MGANLGFPTTTSPTNSPSFEQLGASPTIHPHTRSSAHSPPRPFPASMVGDGKSEEWRRAAMGAYSAEAAAKGAAVAAG